MSAFQLPRLGSVVWASLEDANGFRKRLPAVVVTATPDITLGKTVRLAAVTTRLPDPLPDDHVLLPWDPSGKARSGLRRKCAAVASWLMDVMVDDLQVAGVLPPNVTNDVLATIARLIPDPPSSVP